MEYMGLTDQINYFQQMGCWWSLNVGGRKEGERKGVMEGERKGVELLWCLSRSEGEERKVGMGLVNQ